MFLLLAVQHGNLAFASDESPLDVVVKGAKNGNGIRGERHHSTAKGHGKIRRYDTSPIKQDRRTRSLADDTEVVIVDGPNNGHAILGSRHGATVKGQGRVKGNGIGQEKQGRRTRRLGEEDVQRKDRER